MRPERSKGLGRSRLSVSDLRASPSHFGFGGRSLNDEPLSYGHGAPLRLRNETQLGFKQVKWLAAIEFVRDFSDIGGGFGSYNADHEFFGYRQSI